MLFGSGKSGQQSVWIQVAAATRPDVVAPYRHLKVCRVLFPNAPGRIVLSCDDGDGVSCAR